MRNLVPVKAPLARGSTLTIGQSASEPEPHRIRSTSLAIGADDLDARGRSPMCHQRTRPSLGGEAEGRSLGFISSRPSPLRLTTLLGSPAQIVIGRSDSSGVFPLFAIFLNECSVHTGGDGGRRSAGRAPRDGGTGPHSRCFVFGMASRRWML